MLVITYQVIHKCVRIMETIIRDQEVKKGSEQ